MDNAGSDHQILVKSVKEWLRANFDGCAEGVVLKSDLIARLKLEFCIKDTNLMSDIVRSLPILFQQLGWETHQTKNRNRKKISGICFKVNANRAAGKPTAESFAQTSAEARARPPKESDDEREVNIHRIPDQFCDDAEVKDLCEEAVRPVVEEISGRNTSEAPAMLQSYTAEEPEVTREDNLLNNAVRMISPVDCGPISSQSCEVKHGNQKSKIQLVRDESTNDIAIEAHCEGEGTGAESETTAVHLSPEKMARLSTGNTHIYTQESTEVFCGDTLTTDWADASRSVNYYESVEKLGGVEATDDFMKATFEVTEAGKADKGSEEAAETATKATGNSPEGKQESARDIAGDISATNWAEAKPSGDYDGHAENFGDLKLADLFTAKYEEASTSDQTVATRAGISNKENAGVPAKAATKTGGNSPAGKQKRARVIDGHISATNWAEAKPSGEYDGSAENFGDLKLADLLTVKYGEAVTSEQTVATGAGISNKENADVTAMTTTKTRENSLAGKQESAKVNGGDTYATDRAETRPSAAYDESAENLGDLKPADVTTAEYEDAATRDQTVATGAFMANQRNTEAPAKTASTATRNSPACKQESAKVIGGDTYATDRAETRPSAAYEESAENMGDLKPADVTIAEYEEAATRDQAVATGAFMADQRNVEAPAETASTATRNSPACKQESAKVIGGDTYATDRAETRPSAAYEESAENMGDLKPADVTTAAYEEAATRDQTVATGAFMADQRNAEAPAETASTATRNSPACKQESAKVIGGDTYATDRAETRPSAAYEESAENMGDLKPADVTTAEYEEAATRDQTVATGAFMADQRIAEAPAETASTATRNSPACKQESAKVIGGDTYATDRAETRPSAAYEESAENMGDLKPADVTTAEYEEAATRDQTVATGAFMADQRNAEAPAETASTATRNSPACKQESAKVIGGDTYATDRAETRPSAAYEESAENMGDLKPADVTTAEYEEAATRDQTVATGAFMADQRNAEAPAETASTATRNSPACKQESAKVIGGDTHATHRAETRPSVEYVESEVEFSDVERSDDVRKSEYEGGSKKDEENETSDTEDSSQDEMKGCQVDKMFYQQEHWTVATIIQKMKPKHLTSKDTSYAGFLAKSFKKPSIPCSLQRLVTFQNSGPGGGLRHEKLKCFVARLFPAFQVERSNIQGVAQGDIYPQFTTKISSKRSKFECSMCASYEQHTKRKSKSLDKVFDCVKHMYQHGISKFHRDAYRFFTTEREPRSSEVQDHVIFPSANRQLLMPHYYSSNRPLPARVPCCHIYEESLVKSFANDQLIHRMSTKKMFETFDKWHCTEHDDCKSFIMWQTKHSDQYEQLKKEEVAQAQYVTLNQTLRVKDKVVKIQGAVKSVHPPCSLSASPIGAHPFTCDNCHNKETYLKMLQSKRGKQALIHTDRIGKRGMRHGYYNKSEFKERAKILDLKLKMSIKRNLKLIKIARKAGDWHRSLLASIEDNNAEKFIMDCLDLFRQKVSNKNPIQLEVLKNLAGKLKSGRNHRFNDLVKRIGKMHKNWLGGAHYGILKEIMGLPSASAVDTYAKQDHFRAGLNDHTFSDVAKRHTSALVIESSDQARVRRTIEARLSTNGSLELLGECWNADPSTWPNVFPVPTPCIEQGEFDEFDALKHHVHTAIEKKELATHASIHNLTSMSRESVSSLISIWPTPNKTYNASSLAKVQRSIRQKCAEQDPPLPIVGHVVDSASFSLQLTVKAMTPSEYLTVNGVHYLGLNIPEEQFMAPFFWRYPSIHFTDYDHNQRSCLRLLKSKTLDLTLYKAEDQQYIASIDHLYQLKNICNSKNISSGLSDSDVIAIRFFDQNSESAHRVFNENIAELLDVYLPEVSLGTSLYIKMVTSIMFPYRVGECHPLTIAKHIGKGLQMLRLWRKYIELSDLRLHSAPYAAENCNKRGHFITRQTNLSLEIQCHAALHYVLAWYLYEDHMKWPTLQKASTISTEHFIGQFQAKTTQYQSLDQEPSFADIIDRGNKIDFNMATMQSLSQNMTIRPSTNRKRTNFKFVSAEENVKDYVVPNSFSEFKDQVCVSLRKGMFEGQMLMDSLPTDFKMQLKLKKSWNTPYTYLKNVTVSSVPPCYNKLHLTAIPTDIPAYSKPHDTYDETEDTELEISDDVEGHCKDVDPNSEQDCTSEEVEIESSGENKMYITKGDSNIHIAKALKMLIGTRDWVSKDRNKRHYITDFVPHLEKIPADHDILLYKDYLIKSKGIFKIIHLVSIRNKKGEREISAKKSSHKCKIRGTLYVMNSSDDSTYALSIPAITTLTKWLSTSSLICEVDILKNEEGSLFLSEDSKQLLDSEKRMSESSEEENSLSSDEYVVEDIKDFRVNPKTQEKEFLTKFKDYSSDHNEWIPGANFRDPIPFSTVSSKGRLRHHSTGHATADAPATSQPKSKSRKRLSSSTESDYPNIQKRKRRSKPIIISETESDFYCDIKKPLVTKRNNRSGMSQEKTHATKPVDMERSQLHVPNSEYIKKQPENVISGERKRPLVTKERRQPNSAGSRNVERPKGIDKEKLNVSPSTCKYPTLENSGVTPNTRNSTGLKAVGIRNIGHTCWFASAIQSLRHVFKRFDHSEDSLMVAIQRLKEEIDTTKRSVVDPGNALEVACVELGFDKSEQNDSSELVRAVLWHAGAYCRVEMVVETQRCLCDHVSSVDDSSTYIQLPLCTQTESDEPLYHSTVQECLSALLNIEESVPNVSCNEPSCHVTGAAIRRQRLVRAGPILVLILNRFTNAGKLNHRIALSRCITVGGGSYSLRSFQTTLV